MRTFDNQKLCQETCDVFTWGTNSTYKVELGCGHLVSLHDVHGCRQCYCQNIYLPTLISGDDPF